MKTAIVAITLATAAFTAAAADSVVPAKPNIIFILADDLGIGSSSCYGADHFKTPNIDKLAANGIRFEHGYSSPLCGPSRALLITGQYSFRTGVNENFRAKLLKPDKDIMIPKVLKPAGYVTGMCGKWNQLPPGAARASSVAGQRDNLDSKFPFLSACLPHPMIVIENIEPDNETAI